MATNGQLGTSRHFRWQDAVDLPDCARRAWQRCIQKDKTTETIRKWQSAGLSSNLARGVARSGKLAYTQELSDFISVVNKRKYVLASHDLDKERDVVESLACTAVLHMFETYEGQARFGIITASHEQAQRCKRELAVLGTYVQVKRGAEADIEVSVVGSLLHELLEAQGVTFITFLEGHQTLANVDYDAFTNHYGAGQYLQHFDQVLMFGFGSKLTYSAVRSLIPAHLGNNPEHLDAAQYQYWYPVIFELDWHDHESHRVVTQSLAPGMFEVHKHRLAIRLDAAARAAAQLEADQQHGAEPDADLPPVCEPGQ